jgi:hypothetical protein
MHHSSNGFVSTVWGPVLWFLLHVLSFAYPVEPSTFDRECMGGILVHLRDVLPCGACRQNIRQTLARLRPNWDRVLSSRDAVSRFVWELHGAVNRTLRGSHYTPPSYDEIRVLYTTLLATQGVSVSLSITPRTTEGTSDNIRVERCSGQSRANTPRAWVVQPALFILHVMALNYAPERNAGYRNWFASVLTALVLVGSTGEHPQLLESAFSDRLVLSRAVSELCYPLYKYPTHPGFYEHFRATTCTRSTVASEGSCTNPVPLACRLVCSSEPTPCEIRIHPSCGIGEPCTSRAPADDR